MFGKGIRPANDGKQKSRSPIRTQSERWRETKASRVGEAALLVGVALVEVTPKGVRRVADHLAEAAANDD